MKKSRFSSKALLSLISLIIVAMLAACGQAASPQSTNGSNAGQGAEADAGASASPSAEHVEPHGPDVKIASMSIHITNNLLALGIKPAGSVVGGDVKDFLPHVADRLKGTAKLGVVTDPDMEAVLALKPDVIYIDEVYSGADLAKFEKIAPTISIDMDNGTWRDHLKRIAEHVDKQAEAEQFIKDYEAKADSVKTLINSKLGADAKVMAIRTTAKELRVMGMKRPVGPIMFEDLGLTPATGVEKITDEPYAVISQEVLPDFDADAIFVIISKGNEAKANFEQLEQNPVWLNLKAVKNNHVYVLDGQKWLDYSSLGHSMALDDAQTLFEK
ncbi:iron-hydroxamate ABC transporter substrate-binding protein [Paenibacillus algorifonticola]|uniref:iron-hydroxamate ABC transporter substrate-binding protein n=1 Tax=Paenibacillus algorifonticola TaxID=684063 RepID=UPI003D28CAA3